MHRWILSGNGIDGGVSGEMLSGEDMENSAAPLDENIPGQYGIENFIPLPEEVGQAMGMTPAMSQNGSMAQQGQPRNNQQQQSRPQQTRQQRNGAQQSQPRQNHVVVKHFCNTYG